MHFVPFYSRVARVYDEERDLSQFQTRFHCLLPFFFSSAVPAVPAPTHIRRTAPQMIRRRGGGRAAGVVFAIGLILSGPFVSLVRVAATTCARSAVLSTKS